jgi:hypothetical protein
MDKMGSIISPHLPVKSLAFFLGLQKNGAGATSAVYKGCFAINEGIKHEAHNSFDTPIAKLTTVPFCMRHGSNCHIRIDLALHVLLSHGTFVILIALL